MKLTYLGHSAYLIETGQSRLALDPFYDADRFDPRPTHVILTHGHADHIGHALDLCSRHDSLLIATAEICNYMKEQGVKKICPLNIGGFSDFEMFRLQFVPAAHSSSADGIHTLGIATGVVLDIEGLKIYHAGDTGLCADMELLGKRLSLDIALLPIGGKYTMDIEQALYAVNLLHPKIAIPMHYGTFEGIEADPHLFIKGLKESTKGHVLEIGQTETFS